MRLRLILSFALIVLVAVAGVVLIARQGAASEVRTFMSRGGMVRLESLAEALEDYYQQHGSWEGAESLLAAYDTGTAGGQGNRPPHAGQGMMGGIMSQALILADADGRIVADSSGQFAGNRLHQDDLSQAIQLKSGLRTVGYLAISGGMTFSLGDERFLVERLTRAALIGGLVAGGLALLLALFLTYRLNQPIQALIGAARNLSAGDLGQRVPVKGQDELAELGQAFNQMASSLQQSTESRQAMTADIAHELRTPLAVQRANLEALQDGIYELTPDNLQPVLDQNQLLTRLVEDLRILALADAGQLKLEFSRVDLGALAERVLDRFRVQAVPRGVSLVLETPPDCPQIEIDPARIEQVLGNLISNALRYVPDPGSIRMKITCEAGFVQLSLHDSGPGIPPEALGRVFERFYRLDRSRSRAEGGSGLGLSIARQLVEAHAGKLSAANHPDGGAVFTLKLPVNQDGAQRG